MDASVAARIEALSNALQKLPIYDGVVMRCSNIPPEVVGRYQLGRVVTERAFLSTSLNPAVARSPAFPGSVEFRILSASARDIASVSKYPAEQEALFPAGSKFYVVGKYVDPMTGRTIIEMIEPIWQIAPLILGGNEQVGEMTCGKIFSTPEEAGVTPPTEAELARARRAFDEFEQLIDAVKPEDRVKELSPKFWDDISGTEYDPGRTTDRTE